MKCLDVPNLGVTMRRPCKESRCLTGSCLTARASVLAALWTLSGFSVLTLETVWMREIALRAGSTAVSSTLVIAVFFLSAALGNLFGARCVAERPHALSFYGGFESAAALSAVAVFALYRWLAALGGFCPCMLSGPVASALLLVGLPSFLSGASFPCLAETFVADADHRTSTGGLFYGLNLLGAGLGVAAGGVWLPWWLGSQGAFAVAVVAQLAGGLLAWRIAAQVILAPQHHSRPCTPAVLPERLGWLLLALSGLLSLAAQTFLIVWARQVFEGSIYAVCGVLAVFLLGLGLGSLAAANLRRKGWSAAQLLMLFATTSALGLLLVSMIGVPFCEQGVALTAVTPAGLLAQALAGCLVVLPLTFCLGGVFPVAWELICLRSASEGRVLGAAMALNKLGAAAGTALGLFLLLPLAGLVHGTILLAWGYLAVAGLPLACAWRSVGWRSVAALGLVAALCAWRMSLPEPVLGLAQGERALASFTGAYGPVTVLENCVGGSRQILLNSRQRLSGTRRALISQRCQSWLPLLFTPKSERVLTIGMAAGISAAAALDFPLKRLYSVELVPEVVKAARTYFGEWNAGLFEDLRSSVLVGDGRAWLARLGGGFDAIICDLFYPGEEGTANLYSREFFELCRLRLNASGVCCLWLPCYQHTSETAGVVIRTFEGVFPYAVAVRANFDPLQPVIGLLGSNRPIPLSQAYLAARLASPVGKKLSASSPLFRSADTAQLLFVMDLHSATPGFEDFPITTDDRPIFAYLGPRQPRSKERIYGFPLLEWVGKRALHPSYPSCDLDGMPAQRLQAAIRAGNYTYAAAAASVSVPGDPRGADVRIQQVERYLQQAASLCPDAAIPAGDLLDSVFGE